MPELYKTKVLLLGDGGVGKTSLIRRFVVDQFGDDYITTIGTKVTKKEVEILEGGTTHVVAMTIWDVLGQKGYSSVQTTAFSGARGVLFVYDVTHPDTRDSLESYWIPRVREVVGNVPAIITGNKVDLVSDRKAAMEDLESVAGRFATPHFLTSAKTGERVEDAFRKLAQAGIGRVEAPFEVLGGDAARAQTDPLVAITDRIMMDFASDFGGVEAAMPVIKKQATRAGLDVRAPTKEAIRRFVENLTEIERGFRAPDKAAASQARRLAWLRDVA